MNDCLVIYIEKDVFDSKVNEVIMKCFQKCFYFTFVEGMLLMSSSFIFKFNWPRWMIFLAAPLAGWEMKSAPLNQIPTNYRLELKTKLNRWDVNRWY